MTMGRLDIAGLPHPSGVVTRLCFKPPGHTTAVSTGDWQPWVKPRNCSWVFMMAVGGGGGGAAGQSGAAGSNRQAGGGGGGGSVSKIWIPGDFLPDVIYIFCGRGGAGGTPSLGAGTTGQNTFVSMTANSTNIADLILSANGGANGTAAGGAGGAAIALNTLIGQHLGMIITAAGGSGTSGGGAGAPGVNLVFGTSGIIITGGTAGGGAPNTANETKAGDITGAGKVNTLPGAPATAGVNGNNGMGIGLGSGIAAVDFEQIMQFAQQPFACLGGTGGASAQAGTAGNGGDGWYGAGGGGGGAGVTGGRGGKGGDGFLYLLAA